MSVQFILRSAPTKFLRSQLTFEIMNLRRT